MIKAVIFDIDGVLLDSFEANRKFFGDLLGSFGYEAPTPEKFKEVFHMTMLGAIKHSTQSKDEEEIQKILEAGTNLDVLEDLLKTPEKLDETIDTLSKNYFLGLVTSRMRGNIYRAPQMKNIEKYFKTEVGYEDVKNHKPHPEPLLLAAERMRVSPEEAVYVGDLEADIIAAKAAGMKIILYSKNALPDADAITYSFAELPEIIKNL